MASNTAENAMGSMLAGISQFSATEVQSSLFNEQINKAMTDMQAVADRSGRAEKLMIEAVNRRLSDPAMQNALRTAFGDFQTQLAQSTANAQSAISNAEGMKSLLKGMGKLAGVAGIIMTEAQLYAAIDSGDPTRIGETVTSTLAGAVGGTLGAIIGGALFSLALAPVAGAAVGAMIGLTLLNALIPDSLKQWIGEAYLENVNDNLIDMFAAVFGFFDAAGNFISDLVNTTFSLGEAMAYDPLTFDLDADGIETLPLDGQNSVLFDHNGDTIKTGTGWVSPDDGFLVRDNGNGTIDTGKELFGDNTVLNDGTLAANGFEALADLDTNADGVIDVNDAAFTELRIWQDANSDAVTQAGELLTLNQAGIASINTAYNGANIAQDGNTISALGSYTKTDGSSSTMGSVASLGNLNLAASTFYTDFITPVTLTPQAEALPTMQGSGLVRDMREAA